MSMRVDDGHNSSPDDDWFASSGQPTVAREDSSPQSGDAYDHEPEWDATADWELDDPASRDVAHRHSESSCRDRRGLPRPRRLPRGTHHQGFDGTVVTITSTVETPAATTPAETTPAATTPPNDPANHARRNDTAETTPAVTTPDSPPASVPADETLRPGTKGSQSVATLQAALTSLGYPAGTPDGSYGPSTVAAVSAFQTAKGLPVDVSRGRRLRSDQRSPREGLTVSATEPAGAPARAEVLLVGDERVGRRVEDAGRLRAGEEVDVDAADAPVRRTRCSRSRRPCRAPLVALPRMRAMIARRRRAPRPRRTRRPSERRVATSPTA